MSYTIQEYTVVEPLTEIPRHDQLPPGSSELGRCMDNTTGRDKLHIVVKHQNHLTILVAYQAGPKDQYFCKQYDFPLQALKWYPNALAEFRKPPADGGLHAGAMISKEANVDGEMLAVGRYTDGYYIVNWSRNNQGRAPGDDYDPIIIYFSYEFLYNGGFLALRQSLGEQLDRGHI